MGAKTVQKCTKTTEKAVLPALSPEARENRCVSLAIDLAEKQLLEGTASAQVITHYLKLGSTKERAEKELLREQIKLAQAKTRSIESNAQAETIYAEAIQAMKRYSGHGDDE